MNTKPFDSSRESQDYYCRGCVHAEEGSCNVMLKDGEDCGDRTEADPEPLTAEAQGFKVEFLH